MPTVLHTISTLARWTVSSFSQLRPAPETREPRTSTCAGPAYRLRRWPALPAGCRTAPVYRTLSVMSCRPVNRQWILLRSGLRASQVDSLLRNLVERGAVEVIDTARFAAPGPELADLV